MKEIEEKKITVVIVDENTELQESLERVTGFSQHCELLGSCENCEEASVQIPVLHPSVVLMDINLGGLDGITCVRNIRRSHPEIQFIMCTDSDEDEKIFEALRAGATGYILKNTSPQKLLEAIRELAEGGAPMSSQVARKVVHAFRTSDPDKTEGGSNFQTLTTRETQILSLLSTGMSYKEIAEKLFISPETVRKHVYHIYEKLHVKNRIEAVNKYFGRSNE